MGVGEPPFAYLGITRSGLGALIILLQGSLKGYILQPFDTWLFPPKFRDATIYKLQRSGVSHVRIPVSPRMPQRFQFVRPQSTRACALSRGGPAEAPRPGGHRPGGRTEESRETVGQNQMRDPFSTGSTPRNTLPPQKVKNILGIGKASSRA